VEFPTGMREELRQVVQAFEITQRNGVVFERKGPVVAVPTKNVGVLLTSYLRCGHRRRRCL
jgi:hypothetical protein